MGAGVCSGALRTGVINALQTGLLFQDTSRLQHETPGVTTSTHTGYQVSHLKYTPLQLVTCHSKVIKDK